MNRPLWWEYSTAGEYLYYQYKYLRALKKVKAKDVIADLSFTNRSSLFNLFKNHVHIKIDDIDLYKRVFFFNDEEVKYIRLLTLRNKAQIDYEIEIWDEEIEKFKKRYKTNPIKNDNSEIFNMWDRFKITNSTGS